jgi:quinoprotein glucose dehydrogenase
VVIAAGGRAEASKTLGDSIVAFALPRPRDRRPGLVSKLIDWPGGRFTAGAMLAALLIVLAAGMLRAWRARRAARRDRN